MDPEVTFLGLREQAIRWNQDEEGNWTGAANQVTAQAYSRHGRAATNPSGHPEPDGAGGQIGQSGCFGAEPGSPGIANS